MTLLLKAGLLAGVLIIAAGGVCAAQQQPQGGVLALPPKERYAATDKNKDGKVTKDEFVQVIAVDARPFIDAIWENRDTNKDGWLTEPEMNANGGGLAGRRGAPPGGGAGAAGPGRGAP